MTLSGKVSIFLTSKKDFLHKKFLLIKNTHAIALTLLGTLIIGGLIGKGSAARSIIFLFDRIQSLNWDNGPVFLIAVKAQNTSNQSFTIKSIAGNAYSDGYLIGNASLFTPVTFRPNTETEFLIKVKLQLINAAMQVIDAFQNGHFKKELTIDARANVDGLPINIKKTLMAGA